MEYNLHKTYFVLLGMLILAISRASTLGQQSSGSGAHLLPPDLRDGKAGGYFRNQ